MLSFVGSDYGSTRSYKVMERLRTYDPQIVPISVELAQIVIEPHLPFSIESLCSHLGPHAARTPYFRSEARQWQSSSE